MTFAEKWSIVCWASSILALIVVYAGLLISKKPVWITGQCIGVLALILCALYWFLP